MDINELREKKAILEHEILNVISPMMEKFKSETGTSPYAISIEMIDATTLSDAHPQYIVAGCKVAIDIRHPDGSKMTVR